MKPKEAFLCTIVVGIIALLTTLQNPSNAFGVIMFSILALYIIRKFDDTK